MYTLNGYTVKMFNNSILEFCIGYLCSFGGMFNYLYSSILSRVHSRSIRINRNLRSINSLSLLVCISSSSVSSENGYIVVIGVLCIIVYGYLGYRFVGGQVQQSSGYSYQGDMSIVEGIVRQSPCLRGCLSQNNSLFNFIDNPYVIIIGGIIGVVGSLVLLRVGYISLFGDNGNYLLNDLSCVGRVGGSVFNCLNNVSNSLLDICSSNVVVGGLSPIILSGFVFSMSILLCGVCRQYLFDLVVNGGLSSVELYNILGSNCINISGSLLNSCSSVFNYMPFEQIFYGPENLRPISSGIREYLIRNPDGNIFSQSVRCLRSYYSGCSLQESRILQYVDSLLGNSSQQRLSYYESCVNNSLRRSPMLDLDYLRQVSSRQVLRCLVSGDYILGPSQYYDCNDLVRIGIRGPLDMVDSCISESLDQSVQQRCYNRGFDGFNIMNFLNYINQVDFKVT